MKTAKVLFIGGALLLAVLLFWGNTDFNPESETYTFSTEISVEVVGASMEPTLQIGQYVIIDTKKTQPAIGDIIYFNCHNRCAHPDGTLKETALIKRVVDIRADGAWFIKGDNQPDSWDSVDYGWLLPEERSDVGVVVRILPQE